MFADSVYDSPWANRSRRGWATLASFGLQALLVAAMLALPMFYAAEIPQVRKIEAPVIAPVSVPPAVAPRPAVTDHQIRPLSNFLGTTLIQPDRIPTGIQQVVDAGPPPGLENLGPTTPGGRVGGNSNFSQIASGFSVARPPAPAATRPVRISRWMEGSLVYRLQPEYPRLAKLTGIQGTVLLRAVIGRDGRISHLETISGHPMLVKAAAEAVLQWRYRPYYLNNEPVEVETQVTVNFVLGR